MADSKKRKVICSVCNGNGFVRVPYEQVRDEQWANCDFCNSQGEIEENIDDDTVSQSRSAMPRINPTMKPATE